METLLATLERVVVESSFFGVESFGVTGVGLLMVAVALEDRPIMLEILA